MSFLKNKNKNNNHISKKEKEELLLIYQLYLHSFNNFHSRDVLLIFTAEISGKAYQSARMTDFYILGTLNFIV